MEKVVFEKAKESYDRMLNCIEILKHARNKSEYMTVTFGTTAYTVDEALRNLIISYYQKMYDENAEIFRNL